ncbi:MAG: hypothetical protein JNM00_06905 [Flavobacteriales bacterium]|nr:hypothetical protein [Flavobacteriales bacterium]
MMILTCNCDITWTQGLLIVVLVSMVAFMANATMAMVELIYDKITIVIRWNRQRKVDRKNKKLKPDDRESFYELLKLLSNEG